MSSDWLATIHPPQIRAWPYAQRFCGNWEADFNNSSTPYLEETIRRYEKRSPIATTLHRHKTLFFFDDFFLSYIVDRTVFVFHAVVLTFGSIEMSSKKPTGKAQRSAIADVVAREYTIHMHKRVRLREKKYRSLLGRCVEEPRTGETLDTG